MTRASHKHTQAAFVTAIVVLSASSILIAQTQPGPNFNQGGATGGSMGAVTGSGGPPSSVPTDTQFQGGVSSTTMQGGSQGATVQPPAIPSTTMQGSTMNSQPPGSAPGAAASQAPTRALQGRPGSYEILETDTQAGSPQTWPTQSLATPTASPTPIGQLSPAQGPTPVPTPLKQLQ